jgi:putative ABC transport system permease protein
MGIRICFDDLLQDLRYTCRFLAKERTFAITVLVTVALSTGSTAAVFTLVDALLLRALPVRSPEQLVSIGVPGRNVDLNPSYFSHAFYEHLRGSDSLFGSLIATSTAVSSGVNVTDGSATDRVRGELVSGNYFDVLGVAAAAGRVLTREDDRTPGAHPVLVLSDAFWQRRFARAPDIVGHTLSVNGSPFTVVGVARQGFFGTRPGFGPDFWATLMMVQSLTAGNIAPLQRDQNYLELMSRLKPGTNLHQAQAAATTIYSNWLQDGATPNANPRVTRVNLQLTPARTGYSLLRGQYRHPLLILMAAVTLLLLIACANVATLLVARATARAREIAIRMAIGASRDRLVRQLITESLLIGVIGGACGWIVCVYLGRTLLSFLPANAEAWQFSPDLRIFAFSLLISMACGVLFGVAPVLQTAQHDGVAALKSGAGRLLSAGRLLDLRGLLVVVQVALSILLVVGAGLFARTLQNLRAVDMGFDRRNILLVSLDPAKSGYARQRTAVFFDQLMQRLRAHKEVETAGLASHGSLSGVLPAGTRFINNQMHAAGSAPGPGQDMTFYNNFVSPQYFESVGIAFLRGRDFNEFDRPEEAQVAIVNEAASRLFFGSEDPIGKRFGRGRQGPATIEVVGLVENARYLTVKEAALPTVYFPFRGHSPMTLHARTMGDPRLVLPIVQDEIRALDSALPLFQVQTMEARVDDSLRQERLVATLSAVLSLLGTLVAAIGLYGVINFTVVQRTREIGIRIALGAEPGRVLWMVLRRAATLVGIGIGVGLPFALWSLRVVASFLYEVSPGDPAILIGAVILLAVVGLSASLVPARRAAGTDPWGALRQE